MPQTADTDMGVSIFSYAGQVQFGLITDAALTPDPEAVVSRFEAGRGSDLMSATWHLLPRIDRMMFCLERLVKRTWIWISAKTRVAVGNGGRRALSIAP